MALSPRARKSFFSCFPVAQAGRRLDRNLTAGGRWLLFNTLDFALFFLLVYGAYLVIPARARVFVLLPASLFFYGYWNPRILALLMATVWVNHRAALFLEHRELPAGKRRVALWGAVGFNLAALGFFKYYNFFARSLGDLLGLAGLPAPLPLLEIILPVGISFYTFQVTAYVVDVSRGQERAERSYWNLLFFTTYFPQLVAGPIERVGHLLPRLKQLPHIHLNQVWSGALLASWGLFKKVFVADNLSQFVDVLLVPGAQPPLLSYSVGACAFALQVYADFSGYTDTARGVSRMLGIELTLNFNLPFLSSNPAEFWRRWHITLGAFLRDYVYIPLGGNRVSLWRQSWNVIVVWTLGGLWHGASLGFLVWGIYCGVLVVLYLLSAPLLARIARTHPVLDGMLLYLGRAYTFLTFAHGLLLFRVENPAHLKFVLSNLNPFADGSFLHISVLGQLLFFAGPLLLMQFVQALRGKLEIWLDWPALMLGLACTTGLLAVVWFGVFNADQFFYFQF